MRHFCGAGFVLDVHGLFSHCAIEKQVPNSKHSKVFHYLLLRVCSSRVTLHTDLISEVVWIQTCQSDRSVVLALCTFCSLASVAGPPVSMCGSSDKPGVSFPRSLCSFISRRVASSQGHTDDPVCVLSLPPLHHDLIILICTSTHKNKSCGLRYWLKSG